MPEPLANAPHDARGFRPRPWRLVVGFLLPPLTALGIALLPIFGVTVNGAGVLYLLAVVGSTFIAGMGVAFPAGAVALLLALFFYSEPGHLFRYGPAEQDFLTKLLIAVPIVTLLVGLLKRGDDRTRFETARAQLLENYRDLVQTLDMIVWERDPESGALTFVGSGVQTTLGFPPSAWTGAPDFWSERIHPDDRERARQDLRAALAKGSETTLEYRIIAMDGSVRWIRDAIRVQGGGPMRRARGVMMDVTERRQAEEARRNTEERLDLVSRATNDAIWDWDLLTNQVWWGDAFFATFGYRREEFDPDVSAWSSRIHDDDRERVESSIQRVLDRGESNVSAEYRFLRADGTYAYVFDRGVVLRDANGKPFRVIGSMMDLTERRRAEEEIRDALSELRATLDATADGILFVGSDGRITNYNRRFVEIWGLPDDLVATRDDNRLLAFVLDQLKDPDGFLAKVREIYSHPEVESFDVIEFKDGRVLERYSLPQQLDGRVAGRVWSFRDVTQRRRVEAALRESESLKGAILETALDCIVTMDHEGRIAEFNPAAERTFGIPRAAAIGKRVDELLMPAGLRQAHRSGLARHLATGETRMIGRRTETVGLRADGTEFPIEVTIARISQTGPPLFAGFIRDLTQRREAEDTLRHREEELRQAQKMEAIGRLAGGVAHDFNNLLTAILGHASLLRENMRAGDPARQGIEEIERAGERAAALTRQLLAFSRKQMFEMKVVDLNEVVGDMQRMLHRLIGEHIELIRIPAAELGHVQVDPGQLQQVILNLVINARDAMPHGGKLILETANVEIDDSVSDQHSPLQPGSYVMLAVSDTGVGMDHETQAHMFEPFYTTKEHGKGTGLGLATVYGIVHQSGGHIWVYSQPGQGTTFKIFLPRMSEAAPGSETAVVARPTGGSETVLVVEDEHVVRALVRNTLTHRGYRVLEAANGVEGLRVADRYDGPIDLLVTDVVMPGMGGRELAEELLSRRTGLRVVYMSGYNEDAAGNHGLMAAGNAFLSKPFTLEALARKVREALDASVS